MWFVLISLVIGILGALIAPYNIPSGYLPYVAIMILAGLDSVFGGLTSSINNNFNLKIFISGFVCNALLAAALTYLGVLLNVNINLAAIIVFGTRIFQNFGIIRRFLITKYFPNKPSITINKN